uniref:NADH-ubiquinone oxidoreductase chain 4 n=1 Tax=Metcalfa pruinosa TaxID=1185500 RepID=A0A8F2PV00_9HEMI|nr:NADH dehydrogenase subunit 4 [Metcalfa pruinosa]QWV61026.1 NADH dehydrogenase subunit 4 [Metcalfa pruinosa]WAR47341.1 NADH dehydrogenase subunit 4 [Metcalfa pruinosa]
MMKFIFYLIFMIPFCFFNNWLMFIYMLFFFFFFFFFFCKVNLGFFFFISYIFGVDKVSYIFICLSVWICIMMVYSMFNYSSLFGSIYFLFCMIFLILMLFMVFCVMDFFFFYFFFEGSLIPVFLIIFGWGYQPERLSAGYYLIFYTLFASLPFLICIFYVNSVFGGFMFFFVFNFNFDYLMFFIIFSFLISFPMFGVHLWLPSAHVEAPSSGSMILAGVLLKLGGYGFFRSLNFLYYFFFYYGFFFISLSLFGCVLISLFCLIQSDLSILIAYSSVCHMSMVICGLFTMTSWGVMGSLIFMIGHGFVSSGLFFLVSLIYDRIGTRSLFIIKGLINFMPSLSLYWFFFCSLNMSCPPSINLFSEISIVFGLFSWNYFTFIFIFFILFFSACYSLSIFFLTQHGVFCGVSKFIGVCVVRDYFVIFFHLFPVIFLMFNMYYFFNIF